MSSKCTTSFHSGTGLLVALWDKKYWNTLIPWASNNWNEGQCTHLQALKQKFFWPSCRRPLFSASEQLQFLYFLVLQLRCDRPECFWYEHWPWRPAGWNRRTPRRHTCLQLLSCPGWFRLHPEARTLPTQRPAPQNSGSAAKVKRDVSPSSAIVWRNLWVRVWQKKIHVSSQRNRSARQPNRVEAARHQTWMGKSFHTWRWVCTEYRSSHRKNTRNRNWDPTRKGKTQWSHWTQKSAKMRIGIKTRKLAPVPRVLIWTYSDCSFGRPFRSLFCTKHGLTPLPQYWMQMAPSKTLQCHQLFQPPQTAWNNSSCFLQWGRPPTQCAYFCPFLKILKQPGMKALTNSQDLNSKMIVSIKKLPNECKKVNSKPWQNFQQNSKLWLWPRAQTSSARKLSISWAVFPTNSFSLFSSVLFLKANGWCNFSPPWVSFQDERHNRPMNHTFVPKTFQSPIPVALAKPTGTCTVQIIKKRGQIQQEKTRTSWGKKMTKKRKAHLQGLQTWASSSYCLKDRSAVPCRHWSIAQSPSRTSPSGSRRRSPHQHRENWTRSSLPPCYWSLKGNHEIRLKTTDFLRDVSWCATVLWIHTSQFGCLVAYNLVRVSTHQAACHGLPPDPSASCAVECPAPRLRQPPVRTCCAEPSFALGLLAVGKMVNVCENVGENDLRVNHRAGILKLCHKIPITNTTCSADRLLNSALLSFWYMCHKTGEEWNLQNT